MITSGKIAISKSQGNLLITFQAIQRWEDFVPNIHILIKQKIAKVYVTMNHKFFLCTYLTALAARLHQRSF
jgi:hypothetical protein